MPTRTAESGAATFVRSSSPNKEFGPRPDRLRVDANDESRVLVRTPSPVRDGEYPSASQLEVYTEGNWSGSRTMTLSLMNPLGPYRRLSDTVVDDKGVDASFTPVAVGPQAGTNRRWVFDVTAAVAAGWAEGVGRFDWMITTDDNATNWLKGVTANGGFPRLVCETQEVADKPADVSPEGIVSLAAPVFAWAAQQGTYEVRLEVGTVDVDGAWDTTTFDTGAVASTVGRIDTAAEGWAGAADDATYYVRVYNHLSSGWGAPSDPIEVTRNIKPTLTITNPGAVTADSSPAVAWTFANQAAWRVFAALDYQGESWDRQADSRKQPGTTQIWVPEMGGDDPGSVYRFKVRAWDDVDRVASEGDPDYVEASVLSTFTPSEEVAGLDGFSVVQHANDPAMQLVAARTPLPDAALFRRRGAARRHSQAVEDGLSHLDWTCPPNQAVTYVARAVVNGEASAAALEFPARLTVEGLWVIEPDTGRGFRLQGDDLQIVYGDTATTVTPMRAASSIRRVTSLRGLETGFVGRINPTPDRPLEDMEADVWWMRSNPHLELRLIVGDLNVPFEADNPFVHFDTALFFTDRPMKMATFGIRQVGEYPFETI